RQKRWSVPWLPLCLAGAVVAAGGLVFGLSGPRGHPDFLTPQGAAAVQTTDTLALTVNLPAYNGKKLFGDLTVELLDPKGKVLASNKKNVGSLQKARSLRFEFKPPTVPAEQIHVRCRF